MVHPAPRIRQSSRHDRSGCLTCRFRRKKCINSFPVCAACTRLNLQCIQQPARSVVPSKYVEKYGSPAGLAPSLPLAPALAPSLALPCKSLSRRHAMHYYITVLALHLTVSKEFNSFLSAFLPMAMESAVLYDALCAFALGHLALVDSSREDTALMAACDSLRTLATAISKPASSMAWYETTAAACLVLLTAEVGIGDCMGWYTHLLGAKNIILAATRQSSAGQLSRGVEAFMHSAEGRWILRNFAYHDIIGSVTLQRRPLLDWNYLESISDVVDSYLGVGTRLIAYIAEVVCLDDDTRIADNQTTDADDLMATRFRFHSTSQRLEKQLVAWECPPHTPDGLRAIAHAYRSAALVLLYRLSRNRLETTIFYGSALGEDSRKKLIDVVQSKIRTEVDRTLSHVADVSMGIGPESAVLFPLFVAGGDATELWQMDVVRSRLNSILLERRFRNVLHALEILERLWTLRQQHQGEHADWAQLVSDSGACLVLT